MTSASFVLFAVNGEYVSSSLQLTRTEPWQMNDLFSALLKCVGAFGKNERIAELIAVASVKEHGSLPRCSASLGRASTWQGVCQQKQEAGGHRKMEVK